MKFIFPNAEPKLRWIHDSEKWRNKIKKRGIRTEINSILKFVGYYRFKLYARCLIKIKLMTLLAVLIMSLLCVERKKKNNFNQKQQQQKIQLYAPQYKLRKWSDIHILHYSVNKVDRIFRCWWFYYRCILWLNRRNNSPNRSKKSIKSILWKEKKLLFILLNGIV